MKEMSLAPGDWCVLTDLVNVSFLTLIWRDQWKCLLALGTAHVASSLFCPTASIPLCSGTERSANVTSAPIWDKHLCFENIVLTECRVLEAVRHLFCFSKHGNQRVREKTRNSLACLHTVVSGVPLTGDRQVELSPSKIEDRLLCHVPPTKRKEEHLKYLIFF